MCESERYAASGLSSTAISFRISARLCGQRIHQARQLLAGHALGQQRPHTTRLPALSPLVRNSASRLYVGAAPHPARAACLGRCSSATRPRARAASACRPPPSGTSTTPPSCPGVFPDDALGIGWHGRHAEPPWRVALEGLGVGRHGMRLDESARSGSELAEHAALVELRWTRPPVKAFECGGRPCFRKWATPRSMAWLTSPGCFAFSNSSSMVKSVRMPAPPCGSCFIFVQPKALRDVVGEGVRAQPLDHRVGGVPARALLRRYRAV